MSEVMKINRWKEKNQVIRNFTLMFIVGAIVLPIIFQMLLFGSVKPLLIPIITISILLILLPISFGFKYLLYKQIPYTIEINDLSFRLTWKFVFDIKKEESIEYDEINKLLLHNLRDERFYDKTIIHFEDDSSKNKYKLVLYELNKETSKKLKKAKKKYDERKKEN